MVLFSVLCISALKYTHISDVQELSQNVQRCWYCTSFSSRTRAIRPNWKTHTYIASERKNWAPWRALMCVCVWGCHNESGQILVQVIITVSVLEKYQNSKVFQTFSLLVRYSVTSNFEHSRSNYQIIIIIIINWMLPAYRYTVEGVHEIHFVVCMWKPHLSYRISFHVCRIPCH